ncbi:hypothetical protein QBC47DRAFT_351799 [Echria macrotheca]|uniref:MARVEL domain-containing protein n=1 Tax=Echria macrotheca TaxID=438768 RepID=A0AAJ0F2D6_9PEZI|nr:hypothetical protein QBC47DRAFT_351799 [Echria macrotheca]
MSTAPAHYQAAQPAAQPAAYHDSRRNKETGLLTRWVPERLKHSALYRWFLRLVRFLQFVSSAVSLGIFSSRVYKVYRLVNSIKTRRGINGSYGAVEGILAAAVLYTILAMLMSFLLKGGSRGPRWIRWLWVLLDLLFVGAFIAVAVLTRPDGGPAGPKHCYDNRDADNLSNYTGNVTNSDDDSCNLPWGTFILAIVSTVLHAITAAFHEVRDRYREHHATKEQMAAYHNGNGYQNGQGYANGTGAGYTTGHGPVQHANGHGQTYAPNGTNGTVGARGAAY